MFTLESQRAKLASLNARSEKEGEEHVPAADLGFLFLAPNDVLSEFSPELKSSLYRKPDVAEQQELINEAGYLPKLRFPAMSSFKWEYEMRGGSLTVGFGIGEHNDVSIDVRSADSFKFEPMDGGNVLVSFRVQCRPSGAQMGCLFLLIGEEVLVTLTPPEARDAVV